MRTGHVVLLGPLLLAMIVAQAFDASTIYDRYDPPEKFGFQTPDGRRSPDPNTVIVASFTNEVVYFVSTNTLRPSIWTGATVQLDFGHTPLQRAPNIIQPTMPTNRPASTTGRVDQVKEPTK